MKKPLLLFSAALIIALYAIINNHMIERNDNQISSQIAFKYNSPTAEATQAAGQTKMLSKNQEQDLVQQKSNPSVSNDKKSLPKDKRAKIERKTSFPTKKPSVDIDTEELTNNKNSMIINRISRQLEEDDDKEKAFYELVALKDYLKGEDLQSAMKQMQKLSELGGNDILIETFLDQSNPDITEQDRIRILTYVNPEYELSENQVESIFYAYSNDIITGASDTILMTLSQAGGDYGAQILIDIIDSETNYEEYIQQITALGYSDSPVTFDYLNQTLDELVSVDTDEQDTELIALVRNFILQKKNP